MNESRVLHDYAFEVARNTLEDKEILVERDDLNRDEVPENGFVLVRGAAQILDYETIRKIAENINVLDDFFNSEDNQKQRKQRHKDNKTFQESSVMFETFYKDAIRVNIVNAQDCSFIGPLAREHLREDVQALIYKHGSKPAGEWTMLAEVSRIPKSEEDVEEALEAMMGQPAVAGGLPSDMIDQVVTMLNTFQEFMGSVSYPNIAVSPVAVYREIRTDEDS